MKTSLLMRRWGLLVVTGLLVVAGCAAPDGGAPGPAGGDLETLIEQRLAMDPITRSGVFGVDVTGDRVTVRGTVRSESERMRVIGLLRGTPGVAAVNDRLRVIP